MIDAPPPSDSNGEPQARPKVLRRPAQFSRRAMVMQEETSAPLTATGSNHTHARLPVRIGTSWQEDGRFGLALILVVVAINLALSFLLPLFPLPRHDNGGATTTAITNNAAMPAAINSGQSSDITVYADPNDNDDDADAMSLDKLPDHAQQFSTSPSDIPAPTARRLGEDNPSVER